MATFLFNEIIFGPVRSRRLGASLGVNLLPVHNKFCNFDCLYCECGWTCNAMVSSSDIPSRETISILLTSKIREMNKPPDAITFAGNGEPTIHPDFSEIIEDTIDIRNRLCSNARIAVLSNSTTLGKEKVVQALQMTDQPILKLDTAIQESFKTINRPAGLLRISEIIEQLSTFPGPLIIQTLFFRGTYKGKVVDNTTDIELDALFRAYREISPDSVMIYTFERDTPLQSLEKIPENELKEIGDAIESIGFPVEISA